MSERQAPSRRGPSLWPYFVLSGAVSLGYGSIYALLADLRDKYGFSEAELGLIAAAGFLSGLLAQLFLARQADRGRAAAMVRGGLLAATAAMLGCALAGQFWTFLISRILLGLGSGAVAPAIRRIVITDSSQHLGANLGRLGSFEISGFVLGPVLSAVAAQLFGIRAPFAAWPSSICWPCWRRSGSTCHPAPVASRPEYFAGC